MKLFNLLFSLFILLLFPYSLKTQCPHTEVSIQTQTGDWGEEVSWRILDEGGMEVALFQNAVSWTTYDTLICLQDGCYLLEASDVFGDGWNGGSMQIVYDNEMIDYALDDGSLGITYFGINESDCIPFIPGCTDPTALNFDPMATSDDGSCLTLQDVINNQVFDTICYGGPKDNRINWVIQNRGTGNPSGDFANQDEFVQMYKDDLLKAFTLGDPAEQIPYAQYKNFFNLYASWWPDAPSDQEWWSFPIIQQMRNEIFLPWANDETGWATWFSTTKNGGGGGAGLIRDQRVGDGKMYGMGWETLLHEFGHTMPGLLDEYSSNGLWSGGNCWETPNTTGFTTIDDIPWRKWIEPGTPLPTPYTAAYLDKYGAFEGAMTNFFGCHRPTARGCYMGAGGFGEDYGQELCGPCRQRVICFLYLYVNVIENPFPAQNNLDVTGVETLHFSADVLKPEPNTQKYEWFLNGKLIAEGVEEVNVTFGLCDEYELVFAVTDTNSLVRYDPKFEEIYPKPYREFKWTINQTDVQNYDLESDLVIQNPDCTGAANGQIEFQFQGGVSPYSIIQDGIVLENPVTDLDSGTFSFELVDGNGCGIVQSVELEQDDLLEPRLCSEYTNGSWTLWLETQNYDLSDLQILWSTFANTPSISNLQDGNYSVEVATLEGCVIQKSISLNFVEDELGVEELVINTNVGRNSGKIFLDIVGGLPPYSITWEEKLNKDVTDANVANIQASGTTWGHLPQYAFDDDLSEKWLHFVSSDAWISYFVEDGAVVNYYTITSADDVPERDPKDWLFQGSNDGNDWTTLDTRTNENFTSRFQKRGFLFSNTTSYQYYRFYVLENHGDGSIQLQQLEFIGTKSDDQFEINKAVEDESRRIELAAGVYNYTVKDQNGQVVKGTVNVGYVEPFQASDLVVIQDGICQVRIENPNPAFDYYWMPDEDGTSILHIGNVFQPLASGNYYVAAVDPNAAMSNNRKGFAISLENTPEIETTPDNVLSIINPQTDLNYYWYNTEFCATPLHTGTTYEPTEGTGYYYATALKNTSNPDPIDPNNVSGMVLRMDASDLNGDGILDNPAPETSSLLEWHFENGNRWDAGSWFAFRSNHQNGLGIVDFSTIWLQRLQNGESGYQTIMMAYEENPISFGGTAPFEALSQHIPKSEDATTLFEPTAPASTLLGTTFLNGEAVDPLTTPNPLEFCILGTKMTQTINNDIFYTDTHWEGNIGELLLWDHALSDDEMIGISEYLRKKWISIADLESPRRPVFWEDPSNSTNEESKNPIKVFPNPATDYIEIQGMKNTSEIQIVNLEGRVLKIIEVASQQAVLNIQQLLPGMYYLKVLDEVGNAVFVKKIIKL